ncbi:MAG TPA: gliding motility-associated ABC transporter permease subunit GldF [Bacteroidales bacterium]|nr:gliding motility-associated ABC transporter permease subunit GldF [Bacteroidales bacterium]HOK99896.1 gliding motility-associated ABC transporter permease subunit GldF [Bacteroidales bacterium]HPO64541.1 gliding motility-associated ABC transporter permease subunit GldF [Bacteroidales bacterium]
MKILTGVLWNSLKKVVPLAIGKYLCMGSLFRKEITGFFSNITGYLVIIVFLLVNSLLLWVIPGQYNIMDLGYATLSPLFEISPWVFLFLVPAITMRAFAEEKRQGTLELLLTRPLSELQIIFAKYFAALVLVILSLLPTLIFYFSVYLLGNPQGNLDTGGTWGSYLGLFFLAAIYVAIGIFSSSLTDNQVVAFIIATIQCLIMYMGFDVIASLPIFVGYEHWVAYLGIHEHYQSISRGIVDTRDVVYFITVAAFFILLTREVIGKGK